jgi:tetrahydromethanopterin S-methyltransferase subunit B
MAPSEEGALMAKKTERRCKPVTMLERVQQLEHTVNNLHRHQERLIMTAQDLQTAIDGLTAVVAKVAADVAALKATPALITQEQLDKATADVTAANTALGAL